MIMRICDTHKKFHTIIKSSVNIEKSSWKH